MQSEHTFAERVQYQIDRKVTLKKIIAFIRSDERERIALRTGSPDFRKELCELMMQDANPWIIDGLAMDCLIRNLPYALGVIEPECDWPDCGCIAGECILEDDDAE